MYKDIVSFITGLLVTLALLGLPYTPILVAFWACTGLPAFLFGMRMWTAHLMFLVAGLMTAYAMGSTTGQALWFIYMFPGLVVSGVGMFTRYILKEI